ncbi:hypothetical protein V490_05501 [Pseudogymnoascus sp. VKM F-3557]|nr:hypothetical protein V490_05501 [Pseudogymnoascus sp. VKM F-3557]
MAEIFGVAAGAISVASIAIQIADSLRIAIDFWEAVQHGHENINRISTQLHILYDYMTEIQRESRNGQIQGVQEELFRNTLIMMKQDLDKLTDLVSSLILDISPSQKSFSRKIGRVQIALKEAKLLKAKGYVESATNLVHLLQSWQSHTMLQQMNSKIEVIFANSIRVDREPSHCSEISPSLPIPASSEVPIHAYNGYSNTSQQPLTRFTLYSNPAQSSSSPQGNEDAELYSSTKLTIKVLIKLSSYTRGLRFQTNNFLNGYYLNSTRCIPNNSPIFKLCQYGDAQGMLKLFSARTASIYDVDQNGQSLLHHACSSGRLDVCRLLIDLGADIYQPDNTGLIPTSGIRSSLEHGKIIHFMVDAGIDPFHSVGHWCWDKENGDEQTEDVERKIEQILKLTKDLYRIDNYGRTALGCILCYASHDKSHTITLISNWLLLLSKNGVDSHEYLRQEIQRHPNGYKVDNCCRSIKLTVCFNDVGNGLHFDIENVTRSIYRHLDPVYLCEAWRRRGPKPGSTSTCLSRVDEGLIYDGRPLPSASGSWATAIKPNSELELVNWKWIGWLYIPL